MNLTIKKKEMWPGLICCQVDPHSLKRLFYTAGQCNHGPIFTHFFFFAPMRKKH